MRKTFEMHSKWRNIERHLKCILTALLLHFKCSYGIRSATAAHKTRKMSLKTLHHKDCVENEIPQNK